jgi:hypothetical protein
MQKEVEKYPRDYVAAIIMGASLGRNSYVNGFPVPVLTLNGEHDGLHRIRFAVF